jgi:hypothetical protein
VTSKEARDSVTRFSTSVFSSLIEFSRMLWTYYRLYNRWGLRVQSGMTEVLWLEVRNEDAFIENEMGVRAGSVERD